MEKQKNYFNLIEILLAVAVIAFGVTVILGMLPKGMRASRNSAAVSYASDVIEQIGGYLQKNGASAIDDNTKSFDDAVNANDSNIMKDYVTLVEYAYDPSKDMSDVSGYKRTGTAGVFKCNDKDAYVVVMGDVQDVDGEKERRIDFSGLLRVCKKSDVKGNFIVIDHGNHTGSCFNGSEHCGTAGIGKTGKGFALDKGDDGDGVDVLGSTVYMELSYPLSLPYEERTKRYYSFDVAESN